MTNKFFPAAMVALLIFSAALAQDQTGYKVIKTYHISSGGGWDYLAVNKGKLYVSHGTHVNILDEQSGDSTGIIPNTNGVHGIAFDNDLKRGFTSNGRSNTVTIFDLATNRIISEVPSGQNPDAILYEPFSKKIITCNGRSNDLSIINPSTGKVIKTIYLGGKPETAVTDGEGKLYVNVEDKNEIAQVNLTTFTVENHWATIPGKEPTGLVYDKSSKRLFAGCEKLLIVMDATSGKIIDKEVIGDGCDGVAFDSISKIIFTSNGEGTISVIKQTSANDYGVVQTLTTKRGARTIAIDESTHTLFLPTADFEPADPKATPGSWPKVIPGTFQVLVVR